MLYCYLKKMSYHLPKVMMRTMQPQSKSPPKNKLDFKNASGKEILKYLDKSEYLKKSEDVDQRVKLISQCHCIQRMPCSCKKSGNPRQGSWFCKDCMKYKRVHSEHEDLYTD